jgi:hypothetical protein
MKEEDVVQLAGAPEGWTVKAIPAGAPLKITLAEGGMFYCRDGRWFDWNDEPVTEPNGDTLINALAAELLRSQSQGRLIGEAFEKQVRLTVNHVPTFVLLGIRELASMVAAALRALPPRNVTITEEESNG